MTILVCGGRRYSDKAHVDATLDAYRGRVKLLIHGGAGGADSLAHQWANKNNVKTRMFLASWLRYGKKAGPMRNQQMLDEGTPDLVVAFPGGDGTADMMKKARKKGVRVVEA